DGRRSGRAVGGESGRGVAGVRRGVRTGAGSASPGHAAGTGAGVTERLPPGQILTKKWPVLHYSHVPRIDIKSWRFGLRGLVEEPLSVSWSELERFPRKDVTCDIHCVTSWSRFDNRFAGVAVQALLAVARPLPQARFVLVHAEPDYTTNLPLADLERDENL